MIKLISTCGNCPFFMRTYPDQFKCSISGWTADSLEDLDASCPIKAEPVLIWRNARLVKEVSVTKELAG